LGQTRVDLQHLLEDIRDAYPGSLEETIVTEIVANSLDSGAGLLRIETDPAQASLTVIDDGSGMVRRELARYHDIATSAKSRGEGIGFAGVGIKLGILGSEEVFTETRRGSSHVATSWHLASRHRAPWRWMPPSGLVAEHGTAVRLRLRNPLSPLLEPAFLEAVLRRHFQPLFEAGFETVLGAHYPRGVDFVINGVRLEGAPAHPSRATLSIRLGRKRKPSAVGFLARELQPLPEDDQGLAVSTLGKVIKRGWDWLGFSPAERDRVSGLIEVPGLAAALTLNKADFIRTGARGALYLAYRKAVQEAVAAQLAAWGDAPDALEEESRRRKTRPVERDLAAVLAEMADDFPLVASLVEKRAGGQKRLSVGAAGSAGSGTVRAALSTSIETGESPGGGPPASPPPAEAAPASTTDRTDDESRADGGGTGSIDWPGGRGRRRRRVRLGLTIQYESRESDPQLAHLIDTTVWVNESHPAYVRAASTRAEGYHLALSVAMALAPLAVEPAEAHTFVSAFLARWGSAERTGPGPRRSVRRRRSGDG
jgi:histidine kinase/DNA gyrase B/HSP90-like ATPase